MRICVLAAVFIGLTGLAPSHSADNSDVVGILLEMQGTYRPTLELTCDQAAQYGETTSINGNTLFGQETTCELKDGRIVGDLGVLLFKAECSEEGDQGEMEILLHADGGETLAILSPYSVAVWYQCD